MIPAPRRPFVGGAVVRLTGRAIACDSAATLRRAGGGRRRRRAPQRGGAPGAEGRCSRADRTTARPRSGRARAVDSRIPRSATPTSHARGIDHERNHRTAHRHVRRAGTGGGWCRRRGAAHLRRDDRQRRLAVQPGAAVPHVHRGAGQHQLRRRHRHARFGRLRARRHRQAARHRRAARRLRGGLGQRRPGRRHRRQRGRGRHRRAARTHHQRSGRHQRRAVPAGRPAGARGRADLRVLWRGQRRRDPQRVDDAVLRHDAAARLAARQQRRHHHRRHHDQQVGDRREFLVRGARLGVHHAGRRRQAARPRHDAQRLRHGVFGDPAGGQLRLRVRWDWSG